MKFVEKLVSIKTSLNNYQTITDIQIQIQEKKAHYFYSVP